MEPSPRRMVTRPGNATRHPGKVLQLRRPKEVIEEEKQGKLARQHAKEKKMLAEEARKAAGEEHIAQLEAEAATVAAAEQNQYPRHIPKKGSLPGKVNNRTNKLKGVKRKAAELEELTTQADTVPALQHDDHPRREDALGRTLAKRHPAPRPIFKTSQMAQSGQASLETETEEVTPTHPAKQAKRSARPLRRTETEIDFNTSVSKHTSLCSDNLLCFSEPATEEEKMDVDEENDGETPHPTTPGNTGNTKEDDSELTDEEEEDGVFKTPVATLSKYAKNLKNVFVEQSEEEIEVEDVAMEKRQKKKNGVLTVKGKESMKEYNTRQAAVNTKATSHVKSASSGPVPAVGGNDGPQSLIIRNDQLASPPNSVAFDVVPRTTASNMDVVAKDATAAPLQKKKRKKTSVKAPPQIVEESEPERVAGGMRSDEDDTLDRQIALSSPMKGSDLRKLNQDLKIKVEDVKPPSRKPKPTFDNLPRGANDDDAWTQIAIPAYFNEFLGGDNAWIYKEEQFKKLLKIVFDHVYGNRLSLDINKGSVAYEILYQRTCQHRNSFGTKALEVTWTYYRTKVNRNADLTQNREEIAQWASNLLDSRSFLYKGSEKPKPKQSGPMEHPLILQTLTAHFSINTVGRALPGGLTTRRPYCSLALAATAVERALTLFSRQVVEKKTSSGKKTFKLSVVRTLNPDTGTQSTVEHDFSKDNWADVTMEYLRGIKDFDNNRFDRILNEAHQLSRSGGKYQEPLQSTTTVGSSKSFRECLVSEGESSSDSE